MRSVMLDIETLSTKSDACVISFGLAAFNDNGIVATDGCAIRVEDWHGHIDPATVRWWMQQGDEARKNATTGVHTAGQAAMVLRTFLQQHGGDEVWANDPSFDIVIIRHWWERVMKELKGFPIHYREERSCRTIFAEARRHSIDLQSAWFNGVAHDAVSDAACQARGVILARRELFGKRYCPHGALVGQCMDCRPVNGVVNV